MTIAMPKHGRGILTPYEPVTTMRPLGYAGTGPARSLALLDVAGAMPASRRLGSGAVASITGPTVLLQTAF